MKKRIVFVTTILYFTIIILSRKYSDNHFVSFISGISCALALAFFVYMIDKKKTSFKKQN
ncbi:hypothetical protein [Flavobacterium sp. FlaQc-47]|uniref:hypothetical protein n=1 Tax=Flavobacterium sp. FlaQc-47 TaxID=3374180 RepID=UPI00375659B5